MTSADDDESRKEFSLATSVIRMQRNDLGSRYARWIFGAVMLGVLGFAAAAHADHTERASVDPAGGEFATGVSSFLLSRDGRVAIFTPDSPDGTCDTFFVRDLQEQTTSCARPATPTGDAPGTVLLPSGVSFTGRFVALRSADDAGDSQLLLWDRETDETERIDVSSAGEPSFGYPLYEAAVSSDGRFVAFVSAAWDLDPQVEPCDGDHRRCGYVYVRDRTLRTTERVSVAIDGGIPDGGSTRPSLSDDGRFVAFQSEAGNLIRDGRSRCGDFLGPYCIGDVYLFDRRTRRTTKVATPTGFKTLPTGAYGVVDELGRFVDYVLLPETPSNPAAARAAQVHRYDLRTHVTRLLFAAPDGAYVHLPLSADGRFIAYLAPYQGPPYDFGGVEVSNRVDGVFVYDRLRRMSQQADVAPDGSAPSTGRLTHLLTPTVPVADIAGISASGDTVGFVSNAANLVASDENRAADAFVRSLDRGRR